MRKEGTRFCQGISGFQPVGYSSFVGRCPTASREVILFSWAVSLFPAACRRVILLSSEDFRQLAGWLFFFRRRKKNQERRHPFERVDDDLGALPPRPPPTIDGRPSHHRLLPALPCRPGETLPLPAARLSLVFIGCWPDQFHFAAAVRPAPPARKVGRVEAGRAI